MKKRILSVFMAALLVLAMSIPALATGDDTYREPLTLTVLSELANYAGEQPGWFAKEIEDRFNLKLNVISTNLDNSALQTRMSAGDLGDLVVFGDTGEHFAQALKAGLLMDWNELDLTPYTNITKVAQASMDKLSAYATANCQVDGVWGFSHNLAYDRTSWDVVIEPNYGMQARWDAYVLAGKPKLDTIDDLVPFLEAMQAAYPQNELGEKVYAYGGFPDWEDCVMKFTWDLMTWYGYAEYDFMGVNWATGDVVNPLEEGSLYQKMLKVNNELYRKGLFDPESISQNFDTYSTKLRSGRYLMALWGWLAPNYNTQERIDNKVGFLQLGLGDDAPVVQAANPSGGNRLWTIGANCQNPERVLELIDWLCSTEGMMITNNGPQGLCWDYNENGQPYGTEFGWLCYKDGENTDMPAEYGGGKYNDGRSTINNTTIMANAMDPEGGFYYNHDAWEDGIAQLVNPLRQDWAEQFSNGARTGVEYLRSTGRFSLHPATDYVYANRSDELGTKRSQFAPIMKEYSWKCVYATSEEEFNALWAEMVEKCKSFGYDDVVAFYMGEIANKLAAIAEGK